MLACENIIFKNKQTILTNKANQGLKNNCQIRQAAHLSPPGPVWVCNPDTQLTHEQRNWQQIVVQSSCAVGNHSFYSIKHEFI